jgi:hypothetical protein
MNTELLTKTQEMYKETTKKNKELNDALNEMNNKNKTLLSVNDSTMKENSALKDQLNDVQDKYKDIQQELTNYKNKEAQELEFKNNNKPQTFNERKKEQYDKINKPNSDHMIKEPVNQMNDTTEIKLDATNIAARQQAVKEQFNIPENDNNQLDEIMKTIQ